MAQYGKGEYWDDRYCRDPEPFDWYQRWAGLKDVITTLVQPGQQILNIGAGNSRLSEEMYDDGYQSITNIDISATVITAMKEKYSDRPGMVYQQADVRAMDTHADGSFDAVIDKGTMDSVLCGEGSTHNCQKALQNISRVLNQNGVFISVSHGQPTYRLTYLQRPEYGWEVSTSTVQKPMMGTPAGGAGANEESLHYVYVCKKGATSA